MRRLIVLVALALSACGGDSASSGGSNGNGNDLPPVQRRRAVLAANGTLPLFPLTPPLFENPKLSPAGVLIDDRNGTFNPAMVARFALERYSRWRTKQPTNGEDFIATAVKQTDWLAANIECKAGVGVWRYHFPASFDAQPGWASGFANAHAVAALLIMSRFISDPERYIDPALCAINAFDVDVADGGLKTTLGGGGGKWFEEYAVPSRSGVMNGHVFALAGLDYACRYAKINKACELFEDGFIALRTRLHLYDAGFTSMYSLATDNFTSPGYNQLHSQVLYWLEGVKPDPTIKTYADLFHDYEAERNSPIASFTADTVGHGTNQLNDGLWWYGYWSAYRLPVTLDVEIPSGTASRLALAFAGSTALPFDYAPIEADGTVGAFKPAPPPTISRPYTQQEFVTLVGVYDIKLSAAKVRLRFSTPIPGTDVIALRELNVIH
jgi:hypothetical protein